MQNIASRFINATNRHVFLTGRAGTGKTTFLHHIRKTTHKSTVVAAPTGVAAINAGGVTLHSLFQLPFGAFVPSEAHADEGATNFAVNTPASVRRNLRMHSTKRNMIRKMELLIIDEVSMLRADLLDAMDVVLRQVRRRRSVAFGGVQILFVGDLFQLPPVVKDAEWKMLREYYTTLFFFGARALEAAPPVYIELEHIYRQSDPAFISVLNNLRDNRLTDADIERLNRCCDPERTAEPEDGAIYLTTHNRKADRLNEAELEKLPGEMLAFHAQTEGNFDANLYPVHPVLKLRKGAQVMFIKNDTSGEHRFFNGKIGTVEKLEDGAVKVAFDDGSPGVWVEAHTWENKRYVLNNDTGEIEEKVVGTFTHLPLKPAWAITVHKSQGLTFDRAVIDISQAFAAGQVYVALSRLTSLDGLVLSAPIRRMHLPPDPALEAFCQMKGDEDVIVGQLAEESRRFMAETVREAFNFSPLAADIDFHLRTYTKDESLSKKQKHLPWARQLQEDFRPVREVADRFLRQVDRILAQAGEDTEALRDGSGRAIEIASGKGSGGASGESPAALSGAEAMVYLRERVLAAKGYFEPLFKTFGERIGALAAELRKEKKGVKKFTGELEALEVSFYGQLKTIYKALDLIDTFMKDTELTRATMDRPPRAVPDKKGSKGGGTAGKKKKAGTASEDEPGTKSPARPKTKPKKDTKIASLELFDQGKTVKEIADERGLAPVTIEGHLAHSVETGEIDVYRLVDNNAIEEIVKTFEALDTTFLKPAHEALEKRYDYGTLRFVAAWLKKNRQEAETEFVGNRL